MRIVFYRLACFDHISNFVFTDPPLVLSLYRVNPKYDSLKDQNTGLLNHPVILHSFYVLQNRKK
jgi:hypothetical protein